MSRTKSIESMLPIPDGVGDRNEPRSKRGRRELVVGVAIASLLAAACSPGGGGDDRNSMPSYLQQAIDEGDFFRWTPTVGSSGIVVPIEVNDTYPSLTASERDAFESWIVSARDKWKVAMLQTGVPIDTITRFWSRGESFGSGVSKILITIGDAFPDNSSLSGAVVHTSDPYDAGRILAMQMGLARKSGKTGEVFSDEVRRFTVLHEFGHAFGIYDPGPGEAHSDNELDVMSVGGPHWETLSGGDARSIQELYEMSPTRVRSDG